MAWLSSLFQLGLGMGSGWLTITVGFMLESLFLNEWPWWGWALASIPAIILIVWSIWMQSRLARRQRTGTRASSDPPSATVDYIEAGAIVDAYIEPALRDKRSGVLSTVQKDFLDRFDKVTGAKLGEYEYNRDLLHRWMQSECRTVSCRKPRKNALTTCKGVGTTIYSVYKERG